MKMSIHRIMKFALFLLLIPTAGLLIAGERSFGLVLAYLFLLLWSGEKLWRLWLKQDVEIYTALKINHDAPVLVRVAAAAFAGVIAVLAIGALLQQLAGEKLG